MAETQRVRRAIRLHPDTETQVKYWAAKADLSENEYMVEAVMEKIARENQDYDLPTMEQKRLGQIVDELKALSSNQANIERVVVRGFDSLMGLTRGDNYLMDDEDGELQP